jgi:hypothetical protein
VTKKFLVDSTNMIDNTATIMENWMRKGNTYGGDIESQRIFGADIYEYLPDSVRSFTDLDFSGSVNR